MGGSGALGNRVLWGTPRVGSGLGEQGLHGTQGDASLVCVF